MEELEVFHNLHLPNKTLLTPSQKGRRRKEAKHEKEEREARELEEKLKVRYDLTSSNGTSLRPHCRRKKWGRTLNARRKRRRLGNVRNSLRYVVAISSDRTPL